MNMGNWIWMIGLGAVLYTIGLGPLYFLWKLPYGWGYATCGLWWIMYGFGLRVLMQFLVPMLDTTISESLMCILAWPYGIILYLRILFSY